VTKEKHDLLYLAALHGIALTIAFSFMGCATESGSIGLGGGIGAGTGAIIGGIADPGKDGQYRTRNVIVGSVVGGMAGMITGSEIHKNSEELKREGYLKGRASAPAPAAGAVPSLTQPRVRTEWVDSRAVGNRYVEGHFEYIIEENSRWDQTK
jgi:hypothetical protein